MSAKCRAWSKFGKDATSRTLPKVAFCAGWDAAMEHRAGWCPMNTAPRDRRILVKSPAGELYVAHWVQHPSTGDEAYCISEGPDGVQHLIYPVEWREIFA